MSVYIEYHSLILDVSVDQHVVRRIVEIGHCGYKSRAVIEYYKDGKLLSSKELRKDSYLPVQGKITRKRPAEDEDSPPFSAL